MGTSTLILLGLGACSGGKGVDTDTGQPSELEVELLDAQLAALDFAWAVQSRPLLSGDSGVLDWSGLSQDARGVAIDPLMDVHRVVLVQFQDLSLEEVLPMLVSGTLSQQAVTLQVDCSSTEGRCALSEFRFEAGHPIDLNATFLEGSGTWLAWLVDEDGGEPRALLAVEPSDEGAAEQSWLDTDSSLSVVGWTEPSASVVLPLDGDALIGWSQLTRSSQGGTLSPLRLDQAVLARTGESADMSEVLLDLASQSEQVWTASLSGRQSLELQGFTDPTGAAFSGFDGEGRWWLALSCSSCAGSQPSALFALSPQ